MKMNLPKLWQVATFAAAFAAASITYAPARLAASTVEHATDGRIRIHAAHGTAWRGTGDVAVRIGHGDVLLKGARWHWLPERLLSGELAVQVAVDAPGAHARVVVARGIQGLVVREMQLPGGVPGRPT
jgi:hypothetical protein